MNAVITLSETGQITLPKDVLDELGLKPHDKIEVFVERDGSAYLRKARPSLRSLMGSLPLGVPIQEAIKGATDDRAVKVMRELLDEE